MKSLTKAQVERSCLLLAARKQMEEIIKPPKKKKDRDEFLYMSSFFDFARSCKPFPDDLKKAAAKHLIVVIDAELASYNIKA